MQQKKLLVLAAGILQITVIKKAKAMGYYVIAADGDPNARGFLYADKAICANITDEEVSELVARMKDYGIEAFTFSSTWSSAVETAWLFQQAGCTLAGLVEINSQYKAFMSNEYEKVHGYLFKLS